MEYALIKTRVLCLSCIGHGFTWKTMSWDLGEEREGEERGEVWRGREKGGEKGRFKIL